MRFSIALLTVICIASVIGTVVKQNEPLNNYVNHFGPFWADVFGAVNLRTVYSAPWFLLILAFLVLSASLCIARNLPRIAADWNAYKEHVRERSLQAFAHKGQARVAEPREAALARVGELLVSRGWRAKVQTREGSGADTRSAGVMIAARKGRSNKIGYLAAHSSIVLVCIGGLLDGDLMVRTQMALLPLAGLVLGAISHSLGANPAEALIRSTGDWTLRLLCLTLAVTPLRELAGWPALARWRRMLGLFTFFYGVLHALCYAWLDMGLDLEAIVSDIVKRNFILVGTTALLLMLPLAATSFNRAIKALGAARWQALHRAVYAVALLALLHFFWMRAGKNDFAEWSVYAAVLGTLLTWRVWRWWQRSRQRTSRRTGAPGN